MASPQRPEFHGISGDDASQSRGLRPGHPPAGRRVKFLIAWLIGIILIAAFFYWIAWGWEGTGGYWWHRQPTPTQSSTAAMSGTGLRVLDAADKKPYIGQPFHLSNVPIQRKINDSFFWIGENSQPPMLVVLNSNQNPAQFKSLDTGSIVDVAGTVLKAPSTSDAASQWPLNDPDLAQLEKEGVYIQATQIYGAPK